MDRENARAIEWDCAKLVHEFYCALDDQRYSDLANLFAPAGVWNRLGIDLIGPHAILQAMTSRADWVTAHLGLELARQSTGRRSCRDSAIYHALQNRKRRSKGGSSGCRPAYRRTPPLGSARADRRRVEDRAQNEPRYPDKSGVHDQIRQGVLSRADEI